MPRTGSASRCKMQKIKLLGNRAPRVVKSLEYREKKAKVLVDHIIIFLVIISACSEFDARREVKNTAGKS